MPVTRSATNTRSSEETMAAAAVNLNRHLDAFDGTGDADIWLKKFKRFCEVQKLKDEDIVKILPLYFSGPAEVWFMGLTDEEANNNELFDKFKERFQTTITGSLRTLKTETFQNCRMAPSEDVETYIDRLSRLGQQLSKSKEDILDQAQLGLLDTLKNYVMGRDPSSIHEVVKYSRMARAINGQAPPGTQTTPQTTDILLAAISQKMDRMCETQHKLESQQQQLQAEVNAVQHHSAHSNFRGPSQGNYFGAKSYYNAANQDYGAYQNSQCIKPGAYNNSQSGVGRGRFHQPNDVHRYNNSQSGIGRGSVHQSHNVQNRTGSSGCGRCGGKSHSSEMCFHKSKGTICHKCNTPGHLKHMCRGAAPQNAGYRR